MLVLVSSEFGGLEEEGNVRFRIPIQFSLVSTCMVLDGEAATLDDFGSVSSHPQAFSAIFSLAIFLLVWRSPSVAKVLTCSFSLKRVREPEKHCESSSRYLNAAVSL